MTARGILNPRRQRVIKRVTKRVTKRTGDRLSREEHEQLTRLAEELRRFMEMARSVRLRPARESSPRGQARSRLACVLHDYISPAIRDLDSIAEAAARHLEDERAPEG
jgi:hypothetical protein